MPYQPRLLICLLALACAACTLKPPQPARGTTAPELPQHATTPSAPSQNTGESNARARVSDASALAEQTRVLVPSWTAADPALTQARDALGAAQWQDAVIAASRARAEAEAMISDHYARLAAAELQRSYTYTGLDDVQLVQLRNGEETLVAGNARLAYGRLRTLNSELSKRTRNYTVAAGDSLWIISGRPEAYANPLLWPLIWRANLDVIPNPNRLLRGQVLRLRPHPTTEEVVTAVNEARGRAGIRPRIGEIRPAAPE